MYVSLRGKLTEIRDLAVVIEVGGLGYLVHTPTSTLAALPQVGSEVFLHTSFVVREASMSLYGFLERECRDLFELLLTISGIGPRTALSLISHLNPQTLQEAVATGNVKKLSETPGIGKKTAERLILELKGKLDGILFTSSAPIVGHEREALSALIHLGYPQKAAELAVSRALKECPEPSDVAALIRTALKNYSLSKS